MPTYEYACAKCGHEFELFQPISDKPLATCPKESCPQKRWGKGKVKRLIGAGAGLLFKGSGFYITDYRSENYKKGAKKEAPAAPSADTKSAPDPKPASSTKAPAKSDAKAPKHGEKG